MNLASLKNLTAREWIRAAKRGGFFARKSVGSHHIIYQHSDGRRVLFVYHNLGETFGPKTIKQIPQSTNWNEDDLGQLQLL